MTKNVKKGRQMPRTAQTVAKQIVKKARDTKLTALRNVGALTKQVPRGFLGAAGDAKFVDIANANYACDTTGSVTHLSIVPTGTTVNSRDGKAFRPTSFECAGTIYNSTSAGFNKARVLLVWDYQPNKALAGVTDILDSASSYSLKKRENAARFKIIRDWRFDLVGTNSSGLYTDTAFETFDQYVKLPADCVAACTAADTTGAIGNRVTGALLLVTIGNNVAGATSAVLTMTGRVNFMDL